MKKRCHQGGTSFGERAENHIAPRQGLAGALSDLSVGKRSSVTDVPSASLQFCYERDKFVPCANYNHPNTRQLFLRTCDFFLINKSAIFYFFFLHVLVELPTSARSSLK